MSVRQLEASLLHTMLLNRKACDRAAATLSPHDFQYTSNATIFSAICDVASRSENGAAPDLQLILRTIADRNPGFDVNREIANIHQATFHVDPEYTVAYIEEIQKEAERRRIIEVGQRIIDNVKQGTSFDEIQETATRSLDLLRAGLRFLDRPLSESADTFHNLLRTKLPPLESWLGNGVLVKGAFHMMNGTPGYGKSWIVTQLAIALLTGTPFLGIPTRRCRVGLIALEMPPQELQHRIAVCAEAVQAGELDLREGTFIVSSSLTSPINLISDTRRLIEYAKTFHLNILILDPLSRAHTIDESDAQEVGQLIASLDRFRAETDCAVLLVHHEAKMLDKQDDVYSGRGSSRFASDPTSIIRLQKDREGNRLISFPKQNFGAPPRPIYIDYQDGKPFEVIDAPMGREELRQHVENQIIDFLRDNAHRAFNLQEVKMATGQIVSDTSYRKILRESALVRKIGRGANTGYRFHDQMELD